jgi:hypothetical protein
MKKFIFAILFSIFLIGCATTNVESNVSDNNKKAHKELREEFENCQMYNELVKRGLDFKTLDKLNDCGLIKYYLDQFFIDENGMPLDNHIFIQFCDGKNYSHVKTSSSMRIDFSDEYGSKDELLNKGYKEDEIFYYPYFNGEWKDGYRVGKKYMDVDSKRYISYKNYSVNTTKSLLVGLNDFHIENDVDDNEEYYNEISKSDKEYLILDLSYNKGGKTISWFSLEKSIKEMSPKEIFILCSDKTYSMGEWATSCIEAATNIKTTIIGYPTYGGWRCSKKIKVITFDNFTIECYLNDEDITDQYWGWDRYNLPYPIEGIGVTPNIYTNGNAIDSLEVVKHLINDDELSLPVLYKKECLKFGLK